jgi:hypothetical protein
MKNFQKYLTNVKYSCIVKITLAGFCGDYTRRINMGTGICGGIPLDFFFEDEWRRDTFIQESGNEFLVFYRETETDPETGEISYILNYPDLLPRFREYYFGLHTILNKHTVLEQTTLFNEHYDVII